MKENITKQECSLETDAEFLRAELMDVMRLFGSDVPKVKQIFSADGYKFNNTIQIDGREYTFSEEQEYSGEIEFKRYARRFAKLALYESLKAETGRSMPWGALTGIRPTKLAYAEEEAGRNFEPLFEKFGVSRENIRLVRAVLESQKGIYSREKGIADLYIGIPFCPSKCNYCSFITADINRTGQYLDGYLDALEKEIAACRGLYRKLKSVYIGGGTPLVLPTWALKRVLDAAAPFVAECAEYTVEAGRPDSVSPEKLRALKDHKVTRISVNPQTMNQKTLDLIGRRHTVDQVKDTFYMARELGFDNINMDLIAGLPGETEENFRYSIDCAVRLAPENITVHTLALKSGSALKEKSGVADTEKEIAAMLEYAAERLCAAGYSPYYMYRQKYMVGNFENVGYSLKGKQCLYNIDMMEEVADIFACGANAISKRVIRAQNRIERAANVKDFSNYIGRTDEMIERKKRLFLD